MSIYDEYRTGEQPCDNFTPVNNEWFGPVRHGCPECYGLRMFCDNCSRDHHRNGWETCVSEHIIPVHFHRTFYVKTRYVFRGKGEPMPFELDDE
jgi:hypothetical protein